MGDRNLGLIRSTDGGTIWEPVSFTGQENFPVLSAVDDAIHGIGSSSITGRASLDGVTIWIGGAELPAADLTVTTDGALWRVTAIGSGERVGEAWGTVQALRRTDGAIVLVDDCGVVWIRGTEATVVLPTGATS